MHLYEVNSASLNAAITLGMTPDEIIKNLDRFCKMLRISKEVKNFIKNTSTQFGKARLVLKDNRYFIEADQKIVIDFYEA